MAAGLRGGLPLFTFKGIEVVMHWSFLLLPAWVALPYILAGTPLRAMASVTLVLILFLCVLLHEFGHALTALHYGIRTRNIMLLPIGGVASLEHMPKEPRKEFWITLAGPLVNLAIALLALAVIGIQDLPVDLTDWSVVPRWDRLPQNILYGNLTLFVFNMIPAFPMDGGRLLRSGLSSVMPRAKATLIAATLGQAVSVGFVAYAIYNTEPFLILVGIFIFMAASAEKRALPPTAAPVPSGAQGSVQEAMVRDLPLLPGTATVQQGLDELQRRNEDFLVVLDDKEVSGVVMRAALQGADPQAKLSAVDAQRVPTVAPADPAEAVGRYMRAQGYPACVVVEQGRLIGVITLAGIDAAAARHHQGPAA